MYYEINVSKNGQHFFATAERSITTESKAREMFDLFRKLFPELHGFKLSVTRWTKEGQILDFNPS